MALFREGEMGLSKKLNSLRKILKNSHPSLVQPFAFWLERLKRLNELRNKFAHSQLVLPEDPPPPEQAAGIHLKCINRSGQQVEEFVERKVVDNHVKDNRYLVIAGYCLLEIVKGRTLGDTKKERDLLELAMAMERAVAA